MKKTFLNSLNFIFLLCPAAFAQLWLIADSTGTGISRQHWFTGLADGCGIVLDSMPPSIDAKKLDDWNDEAHYYVLHPLREGSSDVVRKYGDVLYEYKGVLVLKTMQILDVEEILMHYELLRIFKPVQEEAAPVEENKIQPAHFSPTPTQDMLQEIVKQVNIDTMWAHLTELVAFDRKAATAQKAAAYIQDYCAAFQLQTYTQKVKTYAPNVITVKKGETKLDEFVVIGGHYDAVLSTAGTGADDNGSGTVATMEALRVLSKYKFNRSIIFAMFTAEELGDVGSGAYADSLKKANAKVNVMIDMDMIAYQDAGGVIDVYAYVDKYTELFAEYSAIVNQYVTGLKPVKATGSIAQQSDHGPFWRAGYPAIWLLEDNGPGKPGFCPVVHSANDVIGKGANSKDLMLKIAATATAYAAQKAEVMTTTSVVPVAPSIQSAAEPRVVLKAGAHTVTLNAPNNSSIRVFTVTGKMIAAYKISEASDRTVYLPQSASGVYTVMVQDGIRCSGDKIVIGR